MVITDSTNNKKNHGTINSPTKFFTPENETHRLRIRLDDDLNQIEENEKTLQLPLISTEKDNNEPNDSFNYALLIALYTLQGIPMGLSASIPFLIQQKVKLSMSAVSYASTSSLPIAASIASSAASASRLSYNANAIFALCSWPFSLKLLWAPIVDACFIAKYGRRKSWLVPVQFTAALLMVCGANFVERQLGLGIGHTLGEGMNIKGVTVYFFALYFLMATQDIAVDGWALTMLSKQNRGHGPVCNSIGQNIGYFLSFVGFLALNDAESSEALWRPLLGMKSKPDQGLVSLGTFIRFMGYFMLIVTTGVAILKKEVEPVSRITKYDDSSFIDGGTQQLNSTNQELNVISNEELLEMELDSAKLGLRETYQRLWAVCKLPAVKSLFIILLTYRLPTALGDNVKFLKAVEFGLSKSTTALLSPTIILPIGILVPIIASKIWNNYPLKQFMHAYKVRVTLVPIVDILMLLALRRGKPSSISGRGIFWGLIILSTALQSIVNSLQFNAQMTFFAKRVDPAIGGSYMTLLNTAANLGGTWPAPVVMWLIGSLSSEPHCYTSSTNGEEICEPSRDPFFLLQTILSLLGCLWIFFLGKKVQTISDLPDDAWRTREKRNSDEFTSVDLSAVDVELGDAVKYQPSQLKGDKLS